MPEIVTRLCIISIKLADFFFPGFLEYESMFMTVPPFCEQSAVKSTHGPGIDGSPNVHMISEGP